MRLPLLYLPGSALHSDREPKTVTPLGHGLDDLNAFYAVSQGLAQLGDILRKGNFFYEYARPELLDEVVFGDQLPGILDKDDEGIKDLGCKGNPLSLARQQMLRRVQAEIGKDVYLFDRTGHKPNSRRSAQDSIKKSL